MNQLPDLNILKARSTWVILAAILAFFAPDLALTFDIDAAVEGATAVVDAINELGLVILSVWAWVERKNPGRKLVFFGGWKS